MPRKPRKRRTPFTGRFDDFDEDVMYEGVPFGDVKSNYFPEPTEADLDLTETPRDEGTMYIGALGIIGALFLAIGVFTYLKPPTQNE